MCLNKITNNIMTSGVECRLLHNSTQLNDISPGSLGSPTTSTSCSSTNSPLSSPAPYISSVRNNSQTLFRPFLDITCPIVTKKRKLSFSIENILDPCFGGGYTKKISVVDPGVTSHPIDLSLSQINDVSDKSDQSSDSSDGDIPPGMVRGPNGQLWPAWVFCTRYSDRPSSGPRSRKIKSKLSTDDVLTRRHSLSDASNDKRPRTAFSTDQLVRLKHEFEANRYLTEDRRKALANELGLQDNQIKIWFQNKRAKIKKSKGEKGALAQMLDAQGLYNHSTISADEEESLVVIDF